MSPTFLSLSLNGHVGPVKTAPRQQHIPDERLNGRFTHQSNEEKLLYDGGGHHPERGESQQQLAEPRGMVRVLNPHILLQSTLRFLLKTFYVRYV